MATMEIEIQEIKKMVSEIKEQTTSIDKRLVVLETINKLKYNAKKQWISIIIVAISLIPPYALLIYGVHI